MALGLGSDAANQNTYAMHKFGVEALGSFLVKGTPAGTAYNFHRGINQLTTTWTGFFVGGKDE